LEQREAMGCDPMGYRLLVQDGASPQMRFMRGDWTPVRQEWRCLDLDLVNDNDPARHDPARHDPARHDPARQAEMERIGASVLGGGLE
jgi:hypothetical protein